MYKYIKKILKLAKTIKKRLFGRSSASKYYDLYIYWKKRSIIAEHCINYNNENLSSECMDAEKILQELRKQENQFN